MFAELGFDNPQDSLQGHVPLKGDAAAVLVFRGYTQHGAHKTLDLSGYLPQAGIEFN
jgi:hypothetical protein